MKKLSDETKIIILELLADGITVNRISYLFQVSKSTVHRLIKDVESNRFKTNNVILIGNLVSSNIIKPRSVSIDEEEVNKQGIQLSLFDELFILISNDEELRNNINNDNNEVKLNKYSVPYCSKEINHKFDNIISELKSIRILSNNYINKYAEIIYRHRKGKIDLIELLKDVESNPDAFLWERANKFNCSPVAVSRALKKLDITNKRKKVRHIKSDPDKRKQFLKKLTRYELKGYKIVYLDESGFRTLSDRAKHWSPSGSCGTFESSWERVCNTSVIGAMMDNEFIASVTYDGSVNSDVFKSFVSQALLPELKNKSVIIMDNASIHSRQDILDLINNAGHTVLFLPPYTPEYNPIEKGWAWTKKLFKSFDFGSVYNLFYAVLQYGNVKNLYDSVKLLGSKFDGERFINTLKHCELFIMSHNVPDLEFN